jgi:hypothetical protein
LFERVMFWVVVPQLRDAELGYVGAASVQPEGAVTRKTEAEAAPPFAIRPTDTKSDADSMIMPAGMTDRSNRMTALFAVLAHISNPLPKLSLGKPV